MERIAAAQLVDRQGDREGALKEIQMVAEDSDADLICFPEAYLQGYTRDEALARERAIEIPSNELTEVLERLADCNPVLVIGLIERRGDDLFNTAVVVQKGELLGAYRKTHPNEGIFRAGEVYPVFEVGSRRFGINICSDAQHPEAAEALSQQGVDVILFPLNNMLPTEVANRWRDRHQQVLVERAQQTGAWVVSADVVGTRDEMIAYGCTAVIDPDGQVVDRVAEETPGLIVVELDWAITKRANRLLPESQAID